MRHWSTVFRATTDRGVLFLKCCGPSQAHEPKLTELLQRVAPGQLPTLIARHPRRDWMLLADGGRKARDVLSPAELLREWERVLPRYAELQIALIGRERELLATGAPDFRLERLPRLLRDALGDGPFPQLSAVAASCRELDALGIGATIDHSDLHDGNLLVRGRRGVIFDWGDASVTQPFLSLTTALQFAARRARTGQRDRRILRVRDAYLEPFTTFAPASRLRTAARLGQRLGLVTRLVTWRRVITLTGAPDRGPETTASLVSSVTRAFSRTSAWS
ncbi:MAG: phosphotransferase [Chloroflexota bacterium]|nr:phosphotransferase [Chloroflexota bacterium]